MNPFEISSSSRRKWLQGAFSLGALGAIGTSARAAGPSNSKFQLKKGDVILFQGDSITDAGRDKGVMEPNNGKALGKGYAAMAAGEILLAHGDLELKCYNRGISGNKIPDLASRWDKDAVEAQTRRAEHPRRGQRPVAHLRVRQQIQGHHR